jgi:hypothetical protein
VQDPEVAALLEEGIQFEQVKPPEEEVKVEVKKRALLRDLANRLFRRYDELTGEWVPSRPKQILWGVTVFMAIPVLMWGLGNLGGPKAKPAQAQPTQAKTVQATAPQGVQPPTAEAPGQEPTPPGSPSGAPEAPGQGQPQSGASIGLSRKPPGYRGGHPPAPNPGGGRGGAAPAPDLWLRRKRRLHGSGSSGGVGAAPCGLRGRPRGPGRAPGGAPAGLRPSGRPGPGREPVPAQHGGRHPGPGRPGPIHDRLPGRGAEGGRPGAAHGFLRGL